MKFTSEQIKRFQEEAVSFFKGKSGPVSRECATYFDQQMNRQKINHAKYMEPIKPFARISYVREVICRRKKMGFRNEPLDIHFKQEYNKLKNTIYAIQ